MAGARSEHVRMRRKGCDGKRRNRKVSQKKKAKGSKDGSLREGRHHAGALGPRTARVQPRCSDGGELPSRNLSKDP